jgi:hypothetical protein
MIKKRIIILGFSILMVFLNYYLVNTIILSITVNQFIGVQLITLLLNYVQDYHKEKILNVN